jgi:hypothetical protein
MLKVETLLCATKEKDEISPLKKSLNNLIRMKRTSQMELISKNTKNIINTCYMISINIF